MLPEPLSLPLPLSTRRLIRGFSITVKTHFAVFLLTGERPFPGHMGVWRKHALRGGDNKTEVADLFTTDSRRLILLLFRRLVQIASISSLNARVPFGDRRNGSNNSGSGPFIHGKLSRRSRVSKVQARHFHRDSSPSGGGARSGRPCSEQGQSQSCESRVWRSSLHFPRGCQYLSTFPHLRHLRPRAPTTWGSKTQPSLSSNSSASRASP